MKHGLFGSFLTLLGSTGLALARAPVTPAPAPLAPIPVTEPATGWHDDAGAACNSRLWGGAEYLLWWIKDGRLPDPFVLTGPGNTANPGALNAGGVPFLTDRGIDYPALSGVRATVGGWLGSDGGLGAEVSGFLLPRQRKIYRASSDATGNPVLGFRYQDPPVGGVAAEDIFQVSIPPGNPFGLGPLSGSLAIVSHTRLWGTEANAVLGGGRFQVLAGFRYAELDEDLSLLFNSTAVDGGTEFFLGTPIGAPNGVASTDTFVTRNQFWGGQVGVRGDYALGNLLLGATGKIALGSVHEVVEVTGTSSLIPAVGAPITVAGGQFAGPSNIGRRTRDQFAVLPEVELRVGYQITSGLRATIGYDFLYLSRVVRPANQIDLVVDDRSNPVNPGFLPGPQGTMFPRPLFDRTDFWAQGLTLGLELRF